MRLIGHLESEGLAARFSGLLGAQGIGHEIESDGALYAVWIRLEEDVERARKSLGDFVANPDDARFRVGTAPPRFAVKESSASVRSATRRAEDHVLSSAEGGISLTVALLAICGVLALVTGLQDRHSVVRHLMISEIPFGLVGRVPRWELFLPEVRHGEVWRLFSPALLHFSVAHVLFNLWNFWDLGRMIESRLGGARFLGLVVGLGVVSNLGQYVVSGPRFGGMSGVIYGLLGYAWMMGKYRPSAGIGLHPQVVVMMLVWFVICFTDALGVPVANTAHGVGLAAGIAWGRWAAARG